MALNYIFVGFFLISFVVALVRVIFFGEYEVFGDIVNSTFDMAKVSVTICLGLIGVMALWLGIMKVGEKGGAVKIISKAVSPLFMRLFPGIPKNHPAMGSMMMNLSANMLGLDNAATPLGLKAMDQLQELNEENEGDIIGMDDDEMRMMKKHYPESLPAPKKANKGKATTASDAQIMFLVLNTSGLTIVPVSVMAVMAAKIAEMKIADPDAVIGITPTDVFLPILIATFFSTLVGLIGVGIRQRIKLYDPIVLAYLGGITAAIAGLMWWLNGMTPEKVEKVAAFGGNFIIFGIIIFFITLALFKKVDIFNNFIKGAKEGFDVAIKIIPYLVAMLVAIGVFRASGALDLMMDGIHFLVAQITDETRWVDAMPTAFMKPLSGSGARAMMVESWQTFGIDSFPGKLSAVFQGSTETTFYTLAVYFGAVGIKNTRYTVWYGLLADLAGIIAAIVVAYIFFGGD